MLYFSIFSFIKFRIFWTNDVIYGLTFQYQIFLYSDPFCFNCSKMSEENLQLALKDLINKSRRKYSIKEVLKEFKAAPANRPQKCTSILKDLVELNVLAKPAYTEYCTNVKKLLPYECLKIFLSSYALVSGISSVAATESNDSVEVNKSVPVDDCTLPIADAVLAIKQRISQAASNGVSKSAQFSALFGDNKNCSYSLSATLMMPAKYIDDMKRTDLWLFHVPNNVCIKQNEILALPAMYQEQIVIKELLYCLIGIRGDYIEPIVADGQSPTGLKPLQFKVSNKINSSVCDIAEKILPLANYYYLIQKFILHVRSHDCGQILQALGAAMNQNLQEYYHAIVYLESNKSALNLHELLYILRPIMQAMEVLADIVMEIWESDKFGGAVLSLLIDRIATLTGNDATQQLVVMLTESAAEPYVEMLKLWMLKGVIVGGESGKEFMIEQNDTDDNTDAYWDKCYTLRPNNIPRFLENDAQMILKTGKYLNVIRECGIDMANFMNSFNPALVKFRFSPTNNQHLSFIRQTHRKVSVTLLNLMMQKKDLMGHLTAARRYFLMGQGDIVQQFMDTSEDELMRDVNLTRPMVLETLLGLTLRTSSAKDDPYLNNLHIEIHSYELCEQLTRIQSFNWRDPLSPDKKLDVNAVECFGFHYNVNWPVSLVLSHQTLTQYQMIFRLLFNVKHVERQLCKVQQFLKCSCDKISGSIYLLYFVFHKTGMDSQ